MKLKVLALSLSLLFFGSIATSTYAMATDITNKTVLVDDDDKDKKTKKSTKTKSAEKSGECTSAEKKACCEKSCDGKKSGSNKK